MPVFSILSRHGAVKHHNVTRELFLPVTAGHITAGAIEDAWAVGGADNAEPSVFWLIKVAALPGGFVSFTKCEAVWHSESEAGGMYWSLSSQYGAAGEVWVPHEDAPGVGVTASGGESVLNVQEPMHVLTLPGLASGDYLQLGFHRAGDQVQDTLDTEMYLGGLLFTYVAAQ